jgi:hypothetical protein
MGHRRYGTGVTSLPYSSCHINVGDERQGSLLRTEVYVALNDDFSVIRYISGLIQWIVILD